MGKNLSWNPFLDHLVKTGLTALYLCWDLNIVVAGHSFMYKQSSRSNAPLLPKRKTGAPKLVQFGRYYSHVAYYQHPKISTPSQAVVSYYGVHIRIEQDCYLRGKTPKTENSRSRWQPNEGKSWPTRLWPDLQTRLSLWPFAVRDRFLAKKIQPFSLFWVRYSLGIYSGHGMPDLQTHQLNYPLKVQSIHMHET